MPESNLLKRRPYQKMTGCIYPGVASDQDRKMMELGWRNYTAYYFHEHFLEVGIDRADLIVCVDVKTHKVILWTHFSHPTFDM